MWEFLSSPGSFLAICAIIICGADLIKAFFTWREARKKIKNEVAEEVLEEQKTKNDFDKIFTMLQEIQEHIKSNDQKITNLNSEVQLLKRSDVDGIKSWIVDQYHKFYVQQKWIDSFSYDVIERRYQDYKSEGGNTYIDTLMSRIRTLPMDDPDHNE